MNPRKAFIETGKKKTFIGAIEWPGWCRSARDEESALRALVEYGPRYAQALQVKEIKFQVPLEASDLIVAERHDGNATTDFGAPAAILDADQERMDASEFERLRSILQACWIAYDDTVERAIGKELRKGPRGGGRDLNKIIAHVLDAERSYIPRLGWKFKREPIMNLKEANIQIRQAFLDALEAAQNGELPECGPRGGIIWPPRYFIRRAAWHVLDHAWEIDDRITIQSAGNESNFD